MAAAAAVRGCRCRKAGQLARASSAPARAHGTAAAAPAASPPARHSPALQCLAQTGSRRQQCHRHRLQTQSAGAELLPAELLLAELLPCRPCQPCRRAPPSTDHLRWQLMTAHSTKVAMRCAMSGSTTRSSGRWAGHTSPPSMPGLTPAPCGGRAEGGREVCRRAYGLQLGSRTGCSMAGVWAAANVAAPLGAIRGHLHTRHQHHPQTAHPPTHSPCCEWP